MLPQPLSDAFVHLEAEAKGDLEYALSVFPHMMGSNKDAPETYRGLLALEENGQRKIQYKARHARHGLRNLGLVVMHLIKQTYPMQKVVRVIGENNEQVKKIQANALGIDPMTGQPKNFNDLSVGQYDLIVIDGTSMATNRQALLNQSLEMYQLGLYDKMEVLKYTDVEDKAGLIERIGEVQQLNAQLEQMQEGMKDIEGLNQTLRRQLQQAEIHNGAQKVGLNIERELMATQSEEQLKRARLKDELAIMKRQIQMAQKEAGAAMTNVVERTRHEMALEKLKNSMEAQIERQRSKQPSNSSSS